MEERHKLRMAAYRRYCRWETKRFWHPCPWCGEEIQRDSFDLHEAIVKRSAVPKDLQHLIFVPENVVCLHHKPCHISHGNSREMLRRCLPVMMRVLGASKIGEWYVGLWRGYGGLSIPKGMLPGRKDLSTSRCLDLMWLGARLHGVELPLDGNAWQIEAGPSIWDFRVLVAWKWQRHSRKSKKRVNFRRPPGEYAGVRADRLEYFLDEGYWCEYIAGASGFTVEELLGGFGEKEEEVNDDSTVVRADIW